MSLFSIFTRKEPIQLPFTTDIHCHILPGVDDGSPDVDTSVKLVRRMQAWGINRIIASPHITEATFENTPDILDSALAQLRTALAQHGNDIDVSRSSENRIDDYFRELLANGQIRPLPDDYLIVECSFIQEPWQLDQILYDLKIKGFKPILAHPERYYYYHGRGNRRYDDLHNTGTLFQVNVLSLAGAYGKTEKKVAEELIERGYVDFLGTDLHNTRHADIIDAYLTTSDARRHARTLAPRLLNDKL